MGKLVEEVKEWNTPVIGAYLLWHFTQGYVLHFIASGILTEPSICDGINHRPDIASFVRWFNEEKKSDFLTCLNQNIIRKRKYTLQSIDIAVSCGLLAWNIETAKIYLAAIEKVKRGTSSKGIAVQKLGDKAKKLGHTWQKVRLGEV